MATPSNSCSEPHKGDAKCRLLILRDKAGYFGRSIAYPPEADMVRRKR